MTSLTEISLPDLIRLAEEDFDVTAQYDLGAMYYQGRGAPLDYTEAAKWYRMAAEQGSADAQYTLGLMYRLGRGVPRDDAEAAKWYRMAAEQGDADAQYNLGFMYGKGQGVPQDYTEAVKWYRRAAEQGSADAQHNLDFMRVGERAAVEMVADWMTKHGYATGHGDTIADLLKELEWQLAEEKK